MNKYRKILFQHLDGIVFIPTIIALYKLKILKFMAEKEIFTINDLLNNKKFNAGYLSISLRTLRCLDLITFNHKEDEFTNEYKINDKFNYIYTNIDKFIKISDIIPLHINFIELSNEDFKNYCYKIDEVDFTYLYKQFSTSIYNNLEGIIIGPILANLSFYKKLKIKSNNKIEITDTNKVFSDSLCKVFYKIGYIDKESKITIKGEYFFKKSSSYGVTVSYLNTLISIPKLLTDMPDFIWNRSKDGHETHINRAMNVWGSGGAHKNYFNKIDKIIINIFNQEIEKQPLGVIDVGCGDGTFLKHIYNIIINKTIRKKHIKTHPLILIGTDINEKARMSSKETLKDIKSFIIPGNISKPAEINKLINKKYNLELENFINCRTFLDHNRIFEKPKTIINHQIYSSGNFCFKGDLISSHDLISNFIIHMKSWKPYIAKFGLIIIELHTLNPKITKNHLGETLACAYDATHGYSDQYLIEYQIFKECLEYIGLHITKENEYLYPKEIPTISINYIK